MNLSKEQDAIATPSVGSSYKQLQRFAIAVAVLSVLFLKPLYDLAKVSLQSELYSHVPLIPCVTIYLLWQNRARLTDAMAQTSSLSAVIAAVFALAALAFYTLSYRNSPAANQMDVLSLLTFAFVSFVCAAYLLFLGKNVFCRDGFPIAFLLFMVPMPLVLESAIEVFFQHTSAAAANVMLIISNAPFFRNGLEFRLPGIVIAVAPECSGIRSTLVLFITSLVAGHLFLQSPWKKALLTFFRYSSRHCSQWISHFRHRPALHSDRT